MSLEFKAGIPPTEPEKTKLESETEGAKQKLADLKYTIEKTEMIGGRVFLVYTKPANLEYPALSIIGIDDSEIQREFNLLIERINTQAVLVDEFGSDHDKRSEFFASALGSTDLDFRKTVNNLKHRSQLRGNLISIKFSMLNILSKLVVDKNKKAKLDQKIKELNKIKIAGTEYVSKTLPEKIQYTDDVDRIFIEALNELFAESTEKA